MFCEFPIEERVNHDTLKERKTDNWSSPCFPDQHGFPFHGDIQWSKLVLVSLGCKECKLKVFNVCLKIINILNRIIIVKSIYLSFILNVYLGVDLEDSQILLYPLNFCLISKMKIFKLMQSTRSAPLHPK